MGFWGAGHRKGCGELRDAGKEAGYFSPLRKGGPLQEKGDSA